MFYGLFLAQQNQQRDDTDLCPKYRRLVPWAPQRITVLRHWKSRERLRLILAARRVDVGCASALTRRFSPDRYAWPPAYSLRMVFRENPHIQLNTPALYWQCLI